jgi:hypothetical protein
MNPSLIATITTYLVVSQSAFQHAFFRPSAFSGPPVCVVSLVCATSKPHHVDECESFCLCCFYLVAKYSYSADALFDLVTRFIDHSTFNVDTQRNTFYPFDPRKICGQTIESKEYSCPVFASPVERYAIEASKGNTIGTLTMILIFLQITIRQTETKDWSGHIPTLFDSILPISIALGLLVLAC